MRIVLTKHKDGTFSAVARADRPGERSVPLASGVSKKELKSILKDKTPELEAARGAQAPS